MTIDAFLSVLQKHSITFFTGIPDSLLKPLCDTLMHRWGIDPAHHIVAQNEGGSVALAAGHHLASGKVPCVYLQNSGIGNIINPVASLTSPDVYAIPMLFVVGWRGEPGTKDEPQHVFQGKATLPLLEDMDLNPLVIEEDITAEELDEALSFFEKEFFSAGRSAALVIRKGAFTGGDACTYQNDYTLVREDAVRLTAHAAADDLIVSTTGKISRELFEVREGDSFGHAHDFLTVGSMGHSALIALGIALQRPDEAIWVLDGDGAVLMHMGALGIVGSQKPKHFIHVVLNNAAHETVGGVETVAGSMDFPAIALASGYAAAFTARNEAELTKTLQEAKQAAAKGPVFVDVRVALGARGDLGRPTTTALQNKQQFMAHIQEDKA